MPRTDKWRNKFGSINQANDRTEKTNKTIENRIDMQKTSNTNSILADNTIKIKNQYSDVIKTRKDSYSREQSNDVTNRLRNNDTLKK